MLTRGELYKAQKGATPARITTVPDLLAPLGGAIVYPYANVGEYLNYYKGWAQRCIELRAQKVAMSSWLVMKDGSDTPLNESMPGHWLVDLYMNPFPDFSLREIIEGAIQWLDVSGDAYIYTPAKIFGSKLPQQIWLLPSWAVYIVPGKRNSGQFIERYDYTYSGTRLEIPPNEMIHIRHTVPSLNPYQNYFYGRSKMATIYAKIRVDELTDEYLAQHFDNLALPATVITFPNELDDPAYQTFKQRWLQDFRGAKNAGKTGILTEGADVKAITSGHREVEIQEIMEKNTEIITNSFGVPHSLLTGDNANYATAVANRRNFYTDTISPLAHYIASKMSQHWRKWELGLSIETRAPRVSYAEIDPPMLETLLKNAVVSPNAVARDFGEKGDDPSGDETYLTNTMITRKMAAGGVGVKPPTTTPDAADVKKKP